MAKEANKRDSFDLVQYKGFYFLDYNEKESAYVFKAHHSMTDGLGFVSITANVTDNFDPSYIPKMRKLSPIQKLYVGIALPFSVMSVGIKYLFTPAERNAIHSGKPLKGDKKGYVSNDISVNKIKDKSKQFNTTINDMMMALTSLTLKEYMVSKGDTKSTYINLSVPFSLRAPPTSRDDLELKNDFAMMLITLDLSNNFGEALRMVKKRMDALKNSIEPYGMYYMIQLCLLLPNVITKICSYWICDKMSIVFSNVPGPRVPWKFNGKASKKLMFFAPGLSNIGTSISIFSHEDIFKVSICGDTSEVPEPKEIVTIFEKNVERLLTGEFDKDITTPKPKFD